MPDSLNHWDFKTDINEITMAGVNYLVFFLNLAAKPGNFISPHMYKAEIPFKLAELRSAIEKSLKT